MYREQKQHIEALYAAARSPAPPASAPRCGRCEGDPDLPHELNCPASAPPEPAAGDAAVLEEDAARECAIRAAERYYDNYNGPRGDEVAAELAHRQHEAQKLK